MKVLILLSVVAVALASRQCDENQHYESCGTACPLTCDNYENPPRACVLMCNPGCHCDEGYVKTEDGSCVRPEECPSKAEQCGENQHYDSCGTACPLTCDNYENPPRACVLMCNPGCHCVKGYVKTEDGSCVRPEECPSKAEPVTKTCLAKPDAGMCLAYMPMWYYDVKSEKCFEFIYGGCQGNGNRYKTEQECMDHCRDVKVRKSDAVGDCDLPAEAGVCRGYFPRFYFDRTTGECKSFIYGGCGGNENNFETEDECKQTCGVQKSNSACSLPSVTGPCRAYFRRFYFNTETKTCEEFVYGGCRGNSNNFKTKEDCQSVCGNI